MYIFIYYFLLPTFFKNNTDFIDFPRSILLINKSDFGLAVLLISLLLFQSVLLLGKPLFLALNLLISCSVVGDRTARKLFITLLRAYTCYKTPY